MAFAKRHFARSGNLPGCFGCFAGRCGEDAVQFAFAGSVGRKNVLDIRLKYKNGQPGVTDFRIQSKPSRRMYRGYRELRPIRQGYGLVVISTPSGVMTNTEARKKKVGGEYLFEIW